VPVEMPNMSVHGIPPDPSLGSGVDPTDGMFLVQVKPDGSPLVVEPARYKIPLMFRPKPTEDELVGAIAKTMFDEGTEETSSYFPDEELEQVEFYIRRFADIQSQKLPKSFAPEPGTTIAGVKVPQWLLDKGEQSDVDRTIRLMPTKWPPEAPAPSP